MAIPSSNQNPQSMAAFSPPLRLFKFTPLHAVHPILAGGIEQGQRDRLPPLPAMAHHRHRRRRHGHLPHGFTSSCYRISGLLRLYLLMLFVIATRFGLVVFAFVLTASCSGRPQPGRAYDFYLEDYSGWLKDPVSEDKYWNNISSYVANSKVCAKMGRSLLGSPKFIKMFFLRRNSDLLPCSTMRHTVL